MATGFLRATEFVHQILRETVRPGDVLVDATCGRGNDTVLLAECVGPKGRVHAFDVQEEALDSTAARLDMRGLGDRVTLHACSHDRLVEVLGDDAVVGAVAFNLGYLPRGDKNRITHPSTTLPALAQALEQLAPHGLVVVTVYRGHPGEADEANQVEAFLAGLPQDEFEAVRYGFVNWRNDPPEVFAVRRRPE